MNTQLLLVMVGVSVSGGLVLVRWWVSRSDRKRLIRRLDAWISRTDPAVSSLIESNERSQQSLWNQLVIRLPGLDGLDDLAQQAGLGRNADVFLMLSLVSVGLPVVGALILDLDMIVCLSGGLLVSSVPWLFLLVRRSGRRAKFREQLPEAIDLMVSVLRSGHSIPQAVKAVADEISDPCGGEFAEIFHRMNLGQPLWHALAYSVRRFASYELDLIRRAAAIQAEVGGSMAELMDKTNRTLRQRLKLVRQARTLTAQGRLTAVIVGLLPIILGCALQFLSPGYLNPLFNSEIGKGLLTAVVLLEIVGVVLMTRLSTLKV